MKQDAVVAMLMGTLMGLGLLGCQQDEIQRYQVPRLDNLRPDSSVRMLAVIAPHGDKTWFFKLTGPVADVEAQTEAVSAFLKSIHFSDKRDQPITWTTPASWRQEPKKEMRYASFRMGSSDRPLELSVTALGPEAAPVLPNVNRWRKQLGLEEIGEVEMGGMVRAVKVDGSPATMVDLTAPGAGRRDAQMVPLARNARQPGRPMGEKHQPLIHYRKPDGWEESPAPGNMQFAVFHLRDGDQKAEISIVQMDGTAGGLSANVNRWRRQLGLDPISEEQMRPDLHQLDVAGKSTTYVDLLGPESQGPQRQHMLVVIVPEGGGTWFFKMMGSVDLVGRQKAVFEAFVQSVKFGGKEGKNG